MPDFKLWDVVVADFFDDLFDDRPKWADGSCIGIIIATSDNLLFDWLVLFEEGDNQTLEIFVSEAEIKQLPPKSGV